MTERLEIVISAKDQFSGAFGKLRGALPSLKTLAIASGAAMATYGGAVFAAAKSTATAYDQVQKFSDRIGISTEALSKYQHVAELSGISNEQLKMGFQRMTRRIAEASVGVGVAKKALEELQIPIEDIDSLAPDKQFEKIAESLVSFGTQADRVRIAMQFFDSEGVALLQTLSGGTEGLEAMKEEAEKFGLVVSEKAGKNAAAFNDSLTRLTGSFKGLKNYFAEQVMPTFTGGFNELANMIANNREGIFDFAETMNSKLIGAGKVAVYVIAGMVDAWRGLKMIYQTLQIGFNKYLEVYLKGIDWMLEKTISFMEATNFKGMFDEAIAGAEGFKAVSADMLTHFQEEGAKAKESLLAIVDEGSMISKVDMMVETIKSGYERIKEAGENAAATAVMPGASDETVARVASNLQAMQDLYDQYYLTDAEKLDAWRSAEVEKANGHAATLANIDAVYLKQKTALFQQQQQMEFQIAEGFLGSMASLASAFGKKGFKTYQALSAGKAVISTIAGVARALSEYTYPYSLIVGAGVLASGMAQVAKIKSQKPPAAHGGLDYVPKEQTYLLDQGERVLSPNQNKDLTGFLQGGGGGGSTIENLTVSVLPNATNADAMLQMTEDDWNDIAEQKIIPAMTRLQKVGIEV